MRKKTTALFFALSLGNGLFAQEKPIDPTATQSIGEPTAAAPASPTPLQNDMQTTNRIHQYKQYCYTNILPLAQEAEKSGITATPEEIAAQEKALKAMFPGLVVWENELREQVIANKFSQRINGVKISDADIQNAYKQLQSEYPDGNAPVLADVLPMLQIQTAVENRSVHDRIQELNDRRDAETSQSMVRANEPWPAEEMRIKGADNECIAEHQDSNACLLTIKQFNDFAPYYTILKFLPLDTARAIATRKILADSYIAAEARAKGFAKSENAEEEKRNWMYGYVQHLRENKLGLLVRDRNLLFKSYSMFYDALFSKRYYPYYSIIGSNDSLSVDSISRLCRRTTSPDSQNSGGKTAPLPTVDSSLHWSHSRAAPLPVELSNAVDTLPVQGVSGVLKTPYGFFIIRLDSVQVRDEIRFEDAQTPLTILATKQKWHKMDSLLAAKARSMYEANRRLNHYPDTLSIIARVSPELSGDSLKVMLSKPKHKQKNSTAKADSSMPGARIASSSLPFDIRDSLLDRYEASQGKKSSIGPIHSRYGVWNFTVIGRKGEGGVCPFFAVKKRLIDSLVLGDLDCGVDLSWKNPDSAFDKAALAKCYEAHFYGDNGDDSPRDRNPNDKADHAQKKGDREKEIMAWLSKVTIHSDFLASP